MFALCCRRLHEDGKEEHITDAEIINLMHELYPPENILAGINTNKQVKMKRLLVFPSVRVCKHQKDSLIRDSPPPPVCQKVVGSEFPLRCCI